MKHNKLLEVAVKKTKVSNNALKEFLKTNTDPSQTKALGIRKPLSPRKIINQVMA
jgi:hypothetical protein